MNCSCGIPAVLQTVKQSNSSNFGKGFFCCSTRTCKYFQFANEPLSISSNFRNSRASTHASSSSSAGRQGGPKIKIFFESCENLTFWCGVIPCDPSLVKLIQSLGDRHFKYSASLKMWLVDFEMYDSFLALLYSGPAQYEVEEIPKFLVKGVSNFLKSAEHFQSDPDVDIPQSMIDRLLPFQLEGVKFVLRRNGRALIGDEMGCGKTIQSLAVLYHYRKHWPAAILVPPNLLEQWEREITSNLGEVIRACDVKIIRKGSDVISGKICVISYTALDGLLERDRSCVTRFGVVIADESHLLKSKDAKRTANAVPFLKKAQVALCLSGTPATNRPVELYTQLNGLLPGVFNDYDQFTRRYCDAKPSRFGGPTDVRGASNEKELKLLLNSLVMIRRLKDDVIKLPTKNREVIYVEPDPQYIYELKNCKDQLKALESAQAANCHNPSVLKQLKVDQQSAMTGYYSVTGLAKVSSVKEEVKRIITDLRVKQELLSAAAVVEVEVQDDVPLEIASPGKGKESRNLNDTCNKSLGYAVSVECNDLFEDNVVFIGESKVIDIDDKVEQVNSSSSGKSKKYRRLLRSRAAVVLDSDDDDDIFEDEKEKETALEVVDLSVDIWKSILNGGGKSSTTSHPKGTFKSSSKVSKAKTQRELSATARCRTKERAVSISSPLHLGEKILIFAHHKCVMDAVEDFIRDIDVTYIRIDGEVNVALRDDLIHKFQTDLTTEIALLSISACSTGLNLTRASIVLFAELTWSPGLILQAEDRVHRIGQNADKVKIIYIVCNDTADEIVWSQIQRKHEVIGATVGIADYTNYGRSTNPSKKPQQKSISKFFSGAVPDIDPPVISTSDLMTSTATATVQAASDPYSAYHKENDIKASAGSVFPPDFSLVGEPLTSTNAASDQRSHPSEDVVGTVPLQRPLSPSTKRRIEENRLRALEKLKEAKSKSQGISAPAGLMLPIFNTVMQTGNGHVVVAPPMPIESEIAKKITGKRTID